VDFVNRRYIGIEDVRIFKVPSGDIKFIGTGYHENNTIGVVQGMYAIKSHRNVLKSRELKPAFNLNTPCEKNWVYVMYKGDTHIIYSWYPLKICIDYNDVLHIIAEKPMPGIFKHVRGSTCGFLCPNAIGPNAIGPNAIGPNAIGPNAIGPTKEIWFVVHLVSYEAPRHYYHMLVVFDEELNLKRYSAPFKFEDECIEYCLGLVVEKERVIMTYSTWDRTSKIGIYDKKYIDSLLVY
jgi:hypothetical protein